MYLPPNEQKARFSLAFVSAVAAKAGFWVDEPKIDYDSVDGTVKSTKQMRGGQIYFQAKATSSRNFDAQGVMSFPLPVNNYNHLREATVSAILIVMILPENIPDWMSINEDEALIKYNAYWVSLRGLAPTNNTSTVTISLQKANKLTPDVLQTLMTSALNGGVTS